MSLDQHNILSTLLSSSFNEEQWVEHIRKTLNDELMEEANVPLTIFAVPKALMMTDPNSYIPQLVSIGPYHHLRPGLHDMERYKVAAAKRNQRELENVKLQDIVDQLRQFELRIRSTYHRPVSFSGETLAWMLAVDASFLFEFLQVCSVNQGESSLRDEKGDMVLTKIASRKAHLKELSKNKPAHNAILRDIIMLENQIPLFIMRMILEFQCPTLDSADGMLFSLLVGLCKELSPFETVKGSRKIDIKECAHFLDFLYHYIVPEVEGSSDFFVSINHNEEGLGNPGQEEVDSHSLSKLSCLKKIFELIKKVIHSSKLKKAVKLPWTLLTKLPVIKLLKEPIEHLVNSFQDDEDAKKDDDSGSNERSPLLEEITIPSVTELSEVGVDFVPTEGGIKSIKFDKKSLTFHIPVIKLDENSGVVLRNLVAYEACGASGPLVLTRYTELMNGIIDTEADAMFLCERKIIVNHLKSENEVAELWNGMTKSIRLTEVPTLDKVIGDVNKFYNGRWKVKFGRFMKKYVFGSWKVLTFLAAILLLVLTTLQAFCQVYSCARILRIEGLEPAHE